MTPTPPVDPHALRALATTVEDFKARWERKESIYVEWNRAVIELGFEGAAIIALCDALDTSQREVSRLSAALGEATTPDICGDGDNCYHVEDSFDGLGVRRGHVQEVWANRTLGQWWATVVVTQPETADRDEETDVCLFPTREEAEAVARAASLLPSDAEVET